MPLPPFEQLHTPPSPHDEPDIIDGKLVQVRRRVPRDARVKSVSNVGRPPGTRAQKRKALAMQRVLALRAQGYTLVDIADTLKLSVGTCTQYLTEHRRLLDAAAIDESLDQIAVPLATENLIQGLIAGDKDYTLETLKGRGKLRRNADVAPSTELPELVIRIETPAAGTPPPLAVEGTVIRSETLAPDGSVSGRVVGKMALPEAT